MKTTKKLISVLLAVLMLAGSLTLASFPASAASNWNALKAGLDNFTVKETGTNYDKVHIEAGSAVTFDTPLYTLTVKIASIDSKGLATVQTVMKQKIGDHFFHVTYMSFNGRDHADGDFVRDKDGVGTNTVDLANIQDGVCYISFTVRSNIGYQFNSESDYRQYSDKISYFEQYHIYYFQNVPNIALSGKKLKATTNAITVGTAAGGGSYPNGATVNLTANSGWHFIGWFNGESPVSTDAAYSFTVNENVTFTARFEQDAQPEQPASVCPWCGGTHEGFFQSIVGWFHSIFANLFGARY